MTWAVWDPGLPGRDGVVALRDGDRLRVSRDDGAVLWSGVVRLDRERGFRACRNAALDPATGRPHGRQVVLGCAVDGLQEGMAPEFWARMFFRRLRVRAELAAADGGRLPGRVRRHLAAVADGGLPAPFDHAELDALPDRERADVRRTYGYAMGFVADETGLTPDELGAALGVAGRAVADWRAFDDPGPELDAAALSRILLVMRVFRGVALRWPGHRNPARRLWMRAPQPDGRSPRDLLVAGEVGLRAACRLADGLGAPESAAWPASRALAGPQRR